MAFVLRNTMRAFPPSRLSAKGDGAFAHRLASLRCVTALSRDLRNYTADILLIGGSLVDGWTDDFLDPFSVLRVTGRRPEDLVWLLKALPRNIAFRCAVLAIDPGQLRATDCGAVIARTILSVAGQVDMRHLFRPCGVVELLPDRAAPDPVQDAK